MITREQLRMARAALGWNVIETAERSGVAPNTITRYENGGCLWQHALKAPPRLREGGALLHRGQWRRAGCPLQENPERGEEATAELRGIPRNEANARGVGVSERVI